jgi:hypothetical protein
MRTRPEAELSGPPTTVYTSPDQLFADVLANDIAHEDDPEEEDDQQPTHDPETRGPAGADRPHRRAHVTRSGADVEAARIGVGDHRGRRRVDPNVRARRHADAPSPSVRTRSVWALCRRRRGLGRSRAMGLRRPQRYTVGGFSPSRGKGYSVGEILRGMPRTLQSTCMCEPDRCPCGHPELPLGRGDVRRCGLSTRWPSGQAWVKGRGGSGRRPG